MTGRSRKPTSTSETETLSGEWYQKQIAIAHGSHQRAVRPRKQRIVLHSRYSNARHQGNPRHHGKMSSTQSKKTESHPLLQRLYCADRSLPLPPPFRIQALRLALPLHESLAPQLRLGLLQVTILAVFLHRVFIRGRLAIRGLLFTARVAHTQRAQAIPGQRHEIARNRSSATKV